MTSLAVNCGWTPELIAQDKALKEKYGAGAHITPAKTYVGLNNIENDSVEISPKKDDKKVVSPLVKGGLALGGAYALKKSIPNVFQKVVSFMRPIIVATPNGCVQADNGKSFKFLRDALRSADMKLFNGTSKLSKFVQKHFADLKTVGTNLRVGAFAAQCVKYAGVGLAIYGGYQLIKGIANAISNAKNA